MTPPAQVGNGSKSRQRELGAPNLTLNSLKLQRYLWGGPEEKDGDVGLSIKQELDTLKIWIQEERVTLEEFQGGLGIIQVTRLLDYTMMTFNTFDNLT